MSQTAEAIPPLVENEQSSQTRFSPSIVRPAARRWILHGGLFLLTVVSTTFAGIFTAAPDIAVSDPPLSTPLDYLLFLPTFYLKLIWALIQFAIVHPYIIKDGLIFSAALLAILTAHEMGHYVACRRHGVDATLPYFLPAPPLFIAGTFGAFIKIKSPIPSRRSLLDIGLAGPLAGFVVAFPIAIVGVLTIKHTATIPENVLLLNDPILFRLIAKVSGVELGANALPNPYYMAAWIGLLVTSLNLMPVGQLDGGHGTYAVFGARLHHLIGRIAFVCAAVIAILGYVIHGSPSGFLFTILLGVMLRVRHPQPQVVEPLGMARIVVAVITLIVFVLSFWPFPLTIT
jgi:membrane-associated protease RseP (regulator of RpoE activity)